MDVPKTMEQWRNAVIDERIAGIMRMKGPEGKGSCVDEIAQQLAALPEVADWMLPALLQAAVTAWVRLEEYYDEQYRASKWQSEMSKMYRNHPEVFDDLPF